MPARAPQGRNRSHDPVRAGFFQFSFFRIAKRHSYGSNAVFLSANDIMLPVSNHGRQRLIRLFQSQPGERLPDDLRLVHAGAVQLAAYDFLKIFGKPKMPQNFLREHLRLGGSHRQHPASVSQRPEKLFHTGINLIFKHTLFPKPLPVFFHRQQRFLPGKPPVGFKGFRQRRPDIAVKLLRPAFRLPEIG